MGTATTFTFIEKKIIKGVAITAGLVTQRNAITKNASQLNQFEFKTPLNVLGGNTVDCLNSGLLYGHSTMVKGVVDEIKKQHNCDPKVIITGGTSRFIKELLPSEYIFDELLLLKGLVNIYKKNNKK
jgi:type III pantothenate kinase